MRALWIASTSGGSCGSLMNTSQTGRGQIHDRDHQRVHVRTVRMASGTTFFNFSRTATGPESSMRIFKMDAHSGRDEPA
jgi:hypothetical protein